jgi:1,4-dihydroxy-2-naphthoate octaprenyltransferase
VQLLFWLVYYGSNAEQNISVPWQGMLICSLLVGGFIPLTQIYQHKQDLDDGVNTISYKLGYIGTFIFCAIVYILAWVFMAQFFISNKHGGSIIGGRHLFHSRYRLFHSDGLYWFIKITSRRILKTP